MSGTAAMSTFAGSDVQQDQVEFSDGDIVVNVGDNPSNPNLESELQRVQQEPVAAYGVIEQVQNMD